jgi:hypothetical protein
MIIAITGVMMMMMMMMVVVVVIIIIITNDLERNIFVSP